MQEGELPKPFALVFPIRSRAGGRLRSDILEPMPKVEILSGGKAFDTLAASWDHLSRTCETATPFQARIWIETWARNFASPSRLTTIVVREGADVVGLFPLVSSVSPWRALRPAGTGPSDYLSPLLPDASLVGEMQDALVELGRKRLIDLHQQPSDHFFTAALPYETIDQARCLVLDLPPTYEEYVASLSKSLRYDVRRLGGKALTEKGAVVEWISPETVDEFADQFFHLHRLRWKSRGLPGAFFGRGERFQREWMHAAVPAGLVMMNRLVADGKPAGCVYAMRAGQTCYFYQAGMDPDASSLSPGTILVAKMIEWAIQEGCTTFDFMRGDEPYKRRWKPNRERTNFRILLPPSGVLGNAGKWWNESAWQVELKVRQRFEGKSLRPSKAPKPTP